MNSGPTSERVYGEIKRRILNGMFRPGTRLDPAVLALQVASSVTPIRDALNLLTGEGLVDTGTSEGFHAPHVDEPALNDLYAWNLEVLSLAIKAWDPGAVRLKPGDGSAEEGEGGRFAALALAIAWRSANAEHLRAVRSLNDRLHTARALEVTVVSTEPGELEALREAFLAEDGPRLRRMLSAYHRRRMRSAAAIVRAIYRA